MKRLLAVLALVGIFTLIPVAPTYAAEATCAQPTSDAEALYVASNQSPRQSQAYWWSKTNLTIGISAAPNVDPDQYAAVERAIRTWQMTINQCLDGAVSLTYVPVSPGATANTDIVIRLVPHAGGFAFGGRAECGPSGCNNVIVAYAGPPGRSPSGSEQPLWATEGTALHEIGHALGLGHATNIESTDLMGYGWGTLEFNRVPEISQCDVDALAYVWTWALEGSEPSRPADATFECA